MNLRLISRRQVLVRGASLVAASHFAGSLSLLYGADKSLADERKAYFAEGKIPKLSITIEKADVESLRREPKKYVKAQIEEEGGKEYKDVAVHMKGAAGSFRSIDEKPGLTLNMNKFTDGQF